jgi:hypothetical protein
VRIAVITGGRDRTPSLAELEDARARLERLSIEVVRHGDCRGTDRAVAQYLEARTGHIIEAWPAWPDFGNGPIAGPRRNRAMLDGLAPPHRQGGLFQDGASNTDGQNAIVLVAFCGGSGTRDCTTAALERDLHVEVIPEVHEPRPWNRHHGRSPQPSVYIGRGTPLGNPWPAAGHDAELILGRYRRWLWSKIRPPELGQPDLRDQAVLSALDALSESHHLVCSCWPRPCHAEVVIAAWRWLRKSSGSSQVPRKA